MIRLRGPLCPECGRSGAYAGQDDLLRDTFACMLPDCSVSEYRRDQVMSRSITPAE